MYTSTCQLIAKHFNITIVHQIPPHENATVTLLHYSKVSHLSLIARSWGPHISNTSVGSGHHPVTLTYTTQSMLVGARQAQPRTTHKTASSHPKSLTAHLNLMFSHVAPQPLPTRRNVWRCLRSTWLSSAKHKLKDRTARWNTLDISNDPADLTAMHKNNDSATQNRTLRAESNGA